MAKSERLSIFSDLALIDRYASRFGIDPDLVYYKSFNHVMNFVWMWNEQSDYNERYAENARMFDKPTHE